MPSAVSNPSNPQPGLNGLASAVSDDENSYIVKDDRYIAYFAGNPVPVLDPKQTKFKPSDQVLGNTLQFLMPGKVLVGCLRQYASIFPDSQLVLIDTKPVIQWLFRLHAYGERQLEAGKSTSFESSKGLSDGFEQAVGQVRTNVLIALGVAGQNINTPNAVLSPDSERLARNYAASISDSELAKSVELSRLLSREVPSNELGLSPADRFVIACSKSQLEVPNFPNDASLEILQPYTSIALANLLVAHGSPDEAIIVLTQWLDLWRCSRGEEGNASILVRDAHERLEPHTKGCESTPVIAGARELPAWLGLRAEFELSIILYRLVGEGNIAYRDFMRDHTTRFQQYLEKPITLRRTASEGPPRSITLKSSSQSCASHQVDAGVPGGLGADRNAQEVNDVRVALVRTLVGDENTMLRSELHFVSDLLIPDLENLYGRGILLAKFTPDCLDPGNHDGRLTEVWVPTVADYQITAGLLAVAIADRYQAIATSIDERQRAVEIKTEGKRLIQDGYRVLNPIRLADRNALADASLTRRVFTVSSWEESCLLAERAIEQLRRSEL
jgi:hypothetical protein